jgi:hypothetical protein
MKNSKTKYILGLLVLILVLWMLKGTFFQPSANDLKAGIADIAKYRNENNTGPVQYVFIASVKDSIWKDLETYGNYKPHHKGGNTKVYFFMEGSQMPTQLSPGKTNFDPFYNKACIALYEKTAMGNASLTRYPFFYGLD